MDKNNQLYLLNFLEKTFFIKKNIFLKIYDRNLKVLRKWIGFKLAVFNGRYFIPVFIKENMVGKTLGSFSFSRKILLKSIKKK